MVFNIYYLIVYYHFVLVVELFLSFVTPQMLEFRHVLSKLFFAHLHNLIVQFMFLSIYLVPDMIRILDCARQSSITPNSTCPDIFIQTYSFLIVYSIAPYLNIVNLHCALFDERMEAYIENTYFLMIFCQSSILLYIASAGFSKTFHQQMDEWERYVEYDYYVALENA